MSKLEKVYELMDALSEAVADIFPNESTVSVALGKNGYRHIDVVQWSDEEKPVRQRRSRYLLVQHRCDDGINWSGDSSEDMNRYLADMGELLMEG